MASATISISGTKLGLPMGSETIGPLTITNATTVGAVSELTSINGDNAVTIPANAIGCIIVPPIGSTLAKKYKGAAGDTGISLHLTNPQVICFASGVTSFILNVAGIETIEITWF